MHMYFPQWVYTYLKRIEEFPEKKSYTYYGADSETHVHVLAVSFDFNCVTEDDRFIMTIS